MKSPSSCGGARQLALRRDAACARVTEATSQALAADQHALAGPQRVAAAGASAGSGASKAMT